MGVQTAVASGGAPPAFDIGNLFGLRGFDGRKTGEFNYEPPGARDDPRTDQQAGGWFGRRPKRKDNMWETFLDVPGLDVPEQPKVDPVQASKSAFEDLLASRDNNAAVDEQFVASLADFLQSSANEPEAHNTLRMAQWQLGGKQNRMTRATRRMLAKIVVDKVQLDTIDSDETSDIIATWMLHSRALAYSDTIVDILDAATPGHSLLRIVAKTTVQLLQHDFKHDGALEALPAVTEHWLECLRQCTHLQNPHHSTPEWKAVYELLSPRIPDMRMLALHLSTLEPDDLARIILRHWASVMTVSDVAKDGLELTLDRAGKYLFPRRSQTLENDILLRDFEHLCGERFADPTPQIPHMDGDPIALVDMLDVVRRHGASITNLAHGTMSILTHPNAGPKTPERIHWVIRGSARRNQLGSDSDLATDAIHHLLNAGFVEYAYEVFQDLPGIPLSRCRQLPLAMSTSTNFARHKLWRCLQRQTPDDIVSQHLTLRPPMPCGVSSSRGMLPLLT
ncbi:Hypothetical predicted protein [Lecanosticta acicola]|uniref:Uncharacterized protein n=1 Tax=Lecanosticta acicola TaxID=111012 RepID=A0AAI8Z8Q3_9PEZI|nr:Hypothetical predicted protein [Lecanosticta acicola]